MEITCYIVCFEIRGECNSGMLTRKLQPQFLKNIHSLVSQWTSSHCCYPGRRLPLPSPCLSFASKLRRTMSFSGDGPERSLQHLHAMAAVCRTDGHVVSSRQNLDGVHSSTLRARSSSRMVCDIPRKSDNYIHSHIRLHTNSVSSGRIWILFSLWIRELHALFPLGSMRPWE